LFGEENLIEIIGVKMQRKVSITQVALSFAGYVRII